MASTGEAFSPTHPCRAETRSFPTRAQRKYHSTNAPSKLARLRSPVGTSRVSLKPCRLVLRGWPELVSHCAGRAHPPTRERVETRSAPRRGLLRPRVARAQETNGQPTSAPLLPSLLRIPRSSPRILLVRFPRTLRAAAARRDGADPAGLATTGMQTRRWQSST